MSNQYIEKLNGLTAYIAYLFNRHPDSINIMFYPKTGGWWALAFDLDTAQPIGDDALGKTPEEALDNLISLHIPQGVAA